jgi:thymidylate kinase
VPTVAFIGPDGAGKTTLTLMLRESGVVRFKVLYMGEDVPGGGLALPTTRLIRRLKSRRAGVADQTRASDPLKTSSGSKAGVESKIRRLGSLRGYARLLHRFTEEWFRQFVSFSYQVRGYTVLYDRHFALDFAPEITPPGPESLDRKIHNWCLRRLYPLPDLVIFLDAPGTLLFARKGELTVEELERRRQGFLALGKRIPGFVRVDAAQPLEQVYAEVERHVLRVCGRPPYRPVGEPAQ